MMDNELEKALVVAVEKATDTAGEAKDFLLSELPDVVEQALLWYGVSSFLSMLLGLFALFISVYGGWWVFTHEKYEEWRMISDDAYPIVPLVLLTIVGVPMSIATINITWLKIWLAPKLWLIEFGAQLAQKVT